MSESVLEEKRKNSQAESLHEKDQQVYNNCYEFCSTAINNNSNFQKKKKLFFVFVCLTKTNSSKNDHNK